MAIRCGDGRRTVCRFFHRGGHRRDRGLGSSGKAFASTVVSRGWGRASPRSWPMGSWRRSKRIRTSAGSSLPTVGYSSPGRWRGRLSLTDFGLRLDRRRDLSRRGRRDHVRTAGRLSTQERTSERAAAVAEPLGSACRSTKRHPQQFKIDVQVGEDPVRHRVLDLEHPEQQRRGIELCPLPPIGVRRARSNASLSRGAMLIDPARIDMHLRVGRRQGCHG